MMRLAWLCVQADAATDEVYARLALVAEGEVKMSLKKNPIGFACSWGSRRFICSPCLEKIFGLICVSALFPFPLPVWCECSYCVRACTLLDFFWPWLLRLIWEWGRCR